jgi:GAF domain-containing protein
VGEVRVRYFDALATAAEAVNSSLKLEEVLVTVVRSTAEATRVKGCSILLLDEEAKVLVHTASYGLSHEYLKKGAVVADRSVAEALHGKPVAVRDVAADARVQYTAEALKEGIASMLCVSLVAKGKVLGAIRIYSSQKGDFSPSVTELLTAIASLSALAIQNAKMHEALKEAHQACLRELWHLQP